MLRKLNVRTKLGVIVLVFSAVLVGAAQTESVRRLTSFGRKAYQSVQQFHDNRSARYPGRMPSSPARRYQLPNCFRSQEYSSTAAVQLIWLASAISVAGSYGVAFS
jgi:hypothetical protein